MDPKSILAVIVFVVAVRHGQTALLTTCSSEGDCTGDDGDTNAVCSTDTSNGGDADGNCICTGRFNEDNDACVAKALLTTCSTEVDCQGAGGDPNAVCSTDASNGGKAGGSCICTGNFKEDNAVCVAKGLGDTCSDANECSDVAHSECKVDTCECLDGYTQVDDDCVQNVSNKDCPQGDGCPANAFCEDPKCKCDVGYTEHADKCVEESGAASTKAIAGIVFGSMWILWNILSIM